MSFDVFGMCNPLYDIQAEVSDTLLAELGVAKGGMFLIEEAQQKEMVARIYTHIVNTESGGSGANTMIGIAMLGGSACYTGKIGKDEHGDLYAAKLTERGVKVNTAAGEGTTGICLVLVSPDAERTLCTFLGICRELGPEDVQADLIGQSKYLYVTGYLWDTDTQKAAVLKAMEAAKAAGVKIAFSLSDPFCVGRHKADFLQIVRDHVDLVIGNHEEAMALTDTTNPHDAIRAMAPWCDLAAVTMGGDGSLLRQGDTLVEVAPFKVTPVDTTGAGDMYAAGLLYGLTQGMPLEKTGELAGYLAAQVVAKLGPRLDTLDQEAIARIVA